LSLETIFVERFHMTCVASSTEIAEQSPQQTVARTVAIKLESVTQAQVISSQIRGLPHKTLLIDFVQPFSVLSSLAGFKQQISSIGNHYLPPASWGQHDENGLSGLHKRTCHSLQRLDSATCLLFTGVDVDYLSFQKQQYRETTLYALVTAGVKSNAAHMVKDQGDFHEPGTINILLLSNRQLCPRAMTQSLIVATEAKTAALTDLDIRSSYTPLLHGATGTGTDGLLVVEGCGSSIDYAGGHTKIGELIAKAVYLGVQDAISRWEGVTGSRCILTRLQERKILQPQLFQVREELRNELITALEALLRQPGYAGFMATALALSDKYQAGLVSDLTAFKALGQQLANEIAGTELGPPRDLLSNDQLPPVLQLALNSLVSGLIGRFEKTQSFALTEVVL